MSNLSIVTPQQTLDPNIPNAFTQTWTRMLHIHHYGPSHPREWWIHELMLYLSSHPTAISTPFDASALALGFRLILPSFPTLSARFFADITSLIHMLPIRDGDVIERKLLMELLLRAAKECGMDWWSGFWEQGAVLFGVNYACMLQRRCGGETGNWNTKGTGYEEVADMLGKMDGKEVERKLMGQVWEGLGDIKIDV
jgi:hypothetical protein